MISSPATPAAKPPTPACVATKPSNLVILWTQADSLGADAVGTGHYARVVEKDGRLLLGVSADRMKDQTYFLFSLTQDQLARAKFPLGHLTKDQVRSMAHDRLLPTAQKKESQDICFIGEGGTEGFLASRNA